MLICDVNAHFTTANTTSTSPNSLWWQRRLQFPNCWTTALITVCLMSILICAVDSDSDIDENAQYSQHAHLRAFNEKRDGTHTFQRTNAGVEHPRRRTGQSSGKAHDYEQWASSGARPSHDDEDEDDNDDDDDEDDEYDDDMDESAENGSENGNNGGTGTTTIVLTPIGSAPSLSAHTTRAPPHGAEFSHHNQRVHPLLDAARTITKAPSTTTTTIKRPSDYNENGSNEEVDDDEDDYDGEDDSDEEEDEWAEEKDETKTTATDETPLEPISFPSSETWPFTSTTTASTTTARQTQTEAPSVQLRTTSISRTSQTPTTKKPPTPTRDGSGKSFDNDVPFRIGHLPFFGDLKPGMLALIVGGSLVALLVLTLCVSYICWRLRKKDEGSYICDEQRQPRHYSYAYHKASTREFYA